MSGPADSQHYKSQIFYVRARGAALPAFVVKQDSDPYSPAHEQEALEFAARVLAADGAESTRDLSVVKPLGWGTSPNFLVTRYQPGELAQLTVDRAVLGWRPSRPTEEARVLMTQLARWLGVFRARGAREGGGLDASGYLDVMRERADALRSEMNVDDELNLLLRTVEVYVKRLDDSDLARMGREYPNRGDARPKNFLAGADGVLYGLDMEGFGFGPMEHDLSCMHHALEYDGVRTPGAGRRASMLWQCFFEEYARYGSSESFALLGYLYFLLDKMRKSARQASRAGLRRKLELKVWLRNRLAWMSKLSGDLEVDAQFMRTSV
jgi:hypothetical protein